MKKIVLTGGGTAGHVTPNIALFPEMCIRDSCITAVTAVTTVSITAIIVLSITLFLKFILTSITYTLFFFFKDY